MTMTLTFSTVIEDKLKKKEKERKKIPNHLQTSSHPYSLPLLLKLHSNGLNGAFPI